MLDTYELYVRLVDGTLYTRRSACDLSALVKFPGYESAIKNCDTNLLGNTKSIYTVYNDQDKTTYLYSLEVRATQETHEIGELCELCKNCYRLIFNDDMDNVVKNIVWIDPAQWKFNPFSFTIGQFRDYQLHIFTEADDVSRVMKSVRAGWTKDMGCYRPYLSNGELKVAKTTLEDIDRRFSVF